MLCSGRAEGPGQAGVASHGCGAGHTYARIAEISWFYMLAATKGLITIYSQAPRPPPGRLVSVGDTRPPPHPRPKAPRE